MMPQNGVSTNTSDRAGKSETTGGGLFSKEQAPVRVTEDRKARALQRELEFRRRVYPRRIADGKMTQRQADEEIAVFEAIVADGFAGLGSGAPRAEAERALAGGRP